MILAILKTTACIIWGILKYCYHEIKNEVPVNVLAIVAFFCIKMFGLGYFTGPGFMNEFIFAFSYLASMFMTLYQMSRTSVIYI